MLSGPTGAPNPENLMASGINVVAAVAGKLLKLELYGVPGRGKVTLFA